MRRLPRYKNADDQTQLNAIKYVSVMYAFVVTFIAFITGLLPGVMETALLTSSATTGPLIGVFLLVSDVHHNSHNAKFIKWILNF